MDLIKSSLPEIGYGNGVADEVTAARVTGIAYANLKRGVQIAAHPDNTDVLYVGNSHVSATNGYILKPGVDRLFEIESSEDFYILGAVADQAYSYTYQ